MSSDADKEKKQYLLPGDQIIDVGEERVTAPEALFNGFEENSGIQNLAYQSIQEIDDFEMKRILYSNIILSGGNTLFRNLEDRLYYEMDKMAPLSKMVKIIDRDNRLVSNWAGGAIRCRCTDFESQWMTSSEWEENGTEMLKRRFLM